MSGSDPAIRKATPECGEDTDDILGDAGYDAATISNFRERGVV